MQQLCGLRPNWTQSRFAALAVQPNLMRRTGADVAQPQIEYLLNAGTRIEHQCEQRIVALTPYRGTVDRFEQRFDFLWLKVFDRLVARTAFERHAQHALQFG